VLVAWVEGGAPEGNPIYLPSTPRTTAAKSQAVRGGIEVRESLTLQRDTRLIAIRPEGPVEVAAILPDQTVERLLWIRDFRPKWKRPYVFRMPVSLPRGTQLLVYCSACTGSVKATVFTTPLR